jgi:hypothetical protein
MSDRRRLRLATAIARRDGSLRAAEVLADVEQIGAALLLASCRHLRH